MSDSDVSGDDDSSKPRWIPERTPEFKAALQRLTRKDPVLRRAFEKKIRGVCASPLKMGERMKFPPDKRKIHVKNHWVLFWKVEGNVVKFLECGHHDEFFKG